MNKLIIFLILITQIAYSQQIKRRAFIGIDFDETPNGLLIKKVFEQTPAFKMGLKEGDILTKINDFETKSYLDLRNALKVAKTSENTVVIAKRNGNILELTGKLIDLPKETNLSYEVLYEEVKVKGMFLRAIVTKPSQKKRMPAFLYIQGVGCYPIDTPFDTTFGHVQICRQLSKNQFVTMRLEKSGVGDSQGIPCEQTDFKTELESFEKALQKLKTYTFVDTTQIFLIGHSVGGILAPILAEKYHTKGVAVFGTMGQNWLQYLINSYKNQMYAKQEDFVEIENFSRNLTNCGVKFFEQKQPLEKIYAEMPECEDCLKRFASRTQNYWSQLNDVNVAGLWYNYGGSVLTMWGEKDNYSLRSDHELIAKMINANHPENANFVALPNTDHRMMYVVESREQCLDFNPKIVQEILKWAKNIK